MMKGVDRSRMAFRLRTRMVPKIKMNFKSMHRSNLKCEECELDKEETQEHMAVCPGWAVELGTLDVTRMADKVEFFTRVLRRKQVLGGLTDGLYGGLLNVEASPLVYTNVTNGYVLIIDR